MRKKSKMERYVNRNIGKIQENNKRQIRNRERREPAEHMTASCCCWVLPIAQAESAFADTT